MEVKPGSKVSHLKKGEQLIFTGGVNIYPDLKVLEEIKRKFKPDQKISVYVAAGGIGTGKSSHQNAMVKRLAGNLLDETLPFDVQETPSTLTQGAWVYPCPLYSKSNPDVQILVVDLEGMGAIKDQHEEDTMVNLMKIYLFGMLISSVFAVHVENKIGDDPIKILKKAFDICQKLRSGLKIEPPKTYLLMKDINSNKCARAIQESKELIEKRLGFEQYHQEIKRLILKGKGVPPESFRESLSKDCKQLDGTAYLAAIDDLTNIIGQSPKIDPISLNKLIELQDFVNLIKASCELLNDPDFEENLIVAIDYIKLEKLNEIYTLHLEACVNESIAFAKNTPLSDSIEEFQTNINKYVEKCITNFGEQVSQAMILSRTVENWTKKHQAIFRATTKSIGAVEIFVRRKIEAEENEKLRKEHEIKLEKQMELTQEARHCADILQTQIIKEKEEHKEELARNQQIFDEKIRQLAQETMEKIQKMQDERVEMSEQNKIKLAEVKRNYQENLAKYEQELLEEKTKLENMENARRIDNERHVQEMQHCPRGCGIEIEKIVQDAEEKRRDIEAKMHERELAWTHQKHQQELDHMRRMQELQNQLNQVRAEKSRRESGGLFSFITNIVTQPLQTLAMGLVKAIKL